MGWRLSVLHLLPYGYGTHLINTAAGYRGDGKSCVDIDECAEGSSGCDQTCVNEPGTYHCECADGFNLVSPVLGNQPVLGMPSTGCPLCWGTSQVSPVLGEQPVHRPCCSALRLVLAGHGVAWWARQVHLRLRAASVR